MNVLESKIAFYRRFPIKTWEKIKQKIHQLLLPWRLFGVSSTKIFIHPDHFCYGLWNCIKPEVLFNTPNWNPSTWETLRLEVYPTHVWNHCFHWLSLKWKAHSIELCLAFVLSVELRTPQFAISKCHLYTTASHSPFEELFHIFLEVYSSPKVLRPLLLS